MSVMEERFDLEIQEAVSLSTELELGDSVNWHYLTTGTNTIGSWIDCQ